MIVSGSMSGNLSRIADTFVGDPTVAIGTAPSALHMPRPNKPHPPAAECTNTVCPLRTSPSFFNA